jgi:hypothetical protein
MCTEAECPLCQLQVTSLTSLRRHVGKHLEELSLFALPSHLKQSDDDDEGLDDDIRSLRSVSSDDPPLLRVSDGRSEELACPISPPEKHILTQPETTTPLGSSREHEDEEENEDESPSGIDATIESLRKAIQQIEQYKKSM